MYDRGSLKIKMDDPGIQRSLFKVKHNGSVDFSINKKTSVQELVKVSVYSRQDKTVPYRKLNSGLQITSLVLYH